MSDLEMVELGEEENVIVELPPHKSCVREILWQLHLL